MVLQKVLQSPFQNSSNAGKYHKVVWKLELMEIMNNAFGC